MIIIHFSIGFVIECVIAVDVILSPCRVLIVEGNGPLDRPRGNLSKAELVLQVSLRDGYHAMREIRYETTSKIFQLIP